MKQIIIVLFFVGLFLLGCISQDENNTTMNESENINVNDTNIDNESVIMRNKVIVIETSMGNIEVELEMDKAPITTDNFMNYVESGFYEGTIFHRVIPNFMVQGGGFSPNGSQKSTLKPIKLESQNGLKNLRGTIAMARTNVPDSATSQFFINTKDNSFLDYAPGNPGYAVFGKVVKGMDVVDAIEKIKTTTKGYYEDWPVEDIIIKKVYVKK